ncbi:MAG: hypothetical protein ACT4OU_13030 [Hyphomicrobium sp.]
MIRTLTRVSFGFVLACIAAGLTTVLFVVTPGDLMATPSAAFPDKAGQTFVWGLLAATHSAIFAAAFALIVTGVAEWLGLRGLGYYLLAALLIAMLGFYAQYASEAAGQPTIFNQYAASAFVTAGLIAGFVYWLSAGRYAGGEPVNATLAPKPKIMVETRPATEHPKPPAQTAAYDAGSASEDVTAPRRRLVESETSVPATQATAKKAPAQNDDEPF